MNKKIADAVESLMGKSMAVVEKKLAEIPVASAMVFERINEERMQAEKFTPIEDAFMSESIELFRSLGDGEEYDKAMNALTEDRQKAYRVIREDRERARKVLDDAVMHALSANHRYSSILDSMPSHVRESVIRTFWSIAEELRAGGYDAVMRRFLEILDRAAEES